MTDEEILEALIHNKSTPEIPLHIFACDCAERFLKRKGVTNPIPFDLIKSKRLWNQGLISAAELNKQRDVYWAVDLGLDWAPWWASDRSEKEAAWRAAYWAAEKETAERAWQLRRLQKLIELYEFAGDRLAQFEIESEFQLQKDTRLTYGVEEWG